jgi:hypothetical protein
MSEPSPVPDAAGGQRERDQRELWRLRCHFGTRYRISLRAGPKPWAAERKDATAEDVAGGKGAVAGESAAELWELLVADYSEVSRERLGG